MNSNFNIYLRQAVTRSCCTHMKTTKSWHYLFYTYIKMNLNIICGNCATKLSNFIKHQRKIHFARLKLFFSLRCVKCLMSTHLSARRFRLRLDFESNADEGCIVLTSNCLPLWTMTSLSKIMNLKTSHLNSHYIIRQAKNCFTCNLSMKPSLQ